MHENKHIQWLLEQLPILVRENILTAESAEAVAGRYRPRLSTGSQQNRISLALAVVGAVLIGGGIILLFAHNWENFNRPLRAILSFLPLISAQILTIYAYRNARNSAPWREATAIVHTLMIGSSLALIGQTYHLPSSMPSFMMSWILLTIPMSWVIHSISLNFLLHLGVTIWFFQETGSITRNLTLVALALILTPSVIPFKLLRLPGAGHRVTRWSAALALLCIVPNLLIADVGSTILICFSLLLSVYALLETGPLFRERGFCDKPFATLGHLGIFIVLLLCTVPEIWTEFVLSNENNNNLVIIFTLLALGIMLLIVHRKDINPAGWLVGLTGPVTFFAALMSGNPTFKPVFYWAFCAWLTGLGIAWMASGFRERRLSQVNAGMVILLIHVFIQFMRADIGYLARSIVFIVLGILFLVVNRYLSKQWRSTP